MDQLPQDVSEVDKQRDTINVLKMIVAKTQVQLQKMQIQLDEYANTTQAQLQKMQQQNNKFTANSKRQIDKIHEKRTNIMNVIHPVPAPWNLQDLGIGIYKIGSLVHLYGSLRRSEPMDNSDKTTMDYEVITILPTSVRPKRSRTFPAIPESATLTICSNGELKVMRTQRAVRLDLVNVAYII